MAPSASSTCQFSIDAILTFCGSIKNLFPDSRCFHCVYFVNLFQSIATVWECTAVVPCTFWIRCPMTPANEHAVEWIFYIFIYLRFMEFRRWRESTKYCTDLKNSFGDEKLRLSATIFWKSRILTLLRSRILFIFNWFNKIKIKKYKICFLAI